ncbi:hypothetical protein SAMN02745947_01089 [Rhodococcus rhodochrous J3]|jgi:hypothetical protein|nr:DUF5655 domain-containing protein [Rhodococcus rhodochrous]TWH44830.1 hypothetical protein L612_002900000020 [Rhodococcus rhodochrous J38]SMG19363.1 hypothetical protein SAMN02745947_01089 [Rhodococcus rhodochrous J3]MCD2096181.1 DUF5655 domain-containing protein [Rhodococcus rhodochrous]MCD2120939.1 DUF5655 domain-containing protein [Rhodococcus rhodochrous]MDJ0017804.1 DUF5655 domain-containing protein [Rhodococcus rhodochrous]
MYATVDDYLADKDPAAVDVFRHVRAMILGLGDDVTEHVHASEISWSRGRPFAAAFVYASRLEVALDLPRRIHHATLREAFPKKGTVTTHRLSVSSVDELDDHFVELLGVAYRTAAERRD